MAKETEQQTQMQPQEPVQEQEPALETEPVQETEPAQGQPQSNKELLYERIRAKYPDKQFDDDEAYASQISEDYDSHESELNDYRTRNAEYERQNLAIMDILEEALDDPDKLDAIVKANKDYVDRVAAGRQAEEEYRQNLEESVNVINSVQAEQGISDDELDAAMATLINIVKDGIMGKFTRESILTALNAVNYDRDTAAARDEGEVAGRNAKIEERLRRPESDMPNIGGGTVSPKPKQQVNDIFSLAREAQ